MYINKKIKNYLEEHGIRQDYVASKINMNSVTFSNIVNGKRKLTAEELKQIADALNVNALIFLN